MRQLKNLMKAKKPMWRCGECECITLKCWKENDTFCNCGTSSEGLGVENTAASVEGGMSLFGDASTDNDYVLIEVSIDDGTGDTTVNTTAHGIYADSSLEVSGENVFVTLFNSIDSDYLGAVYGGSTPNGTIQSDAYTALSNLYFNPSADNIAAAKTAIEIYEDDGESFIEWEGE